MAVGIHIVRVNFVSVSTVTGQVIDRLDPSTTINDVLRSEHQHRVIADAAVPNSAGNPTITDYLVAEAADDYVLNHLGQNIIVTYEQ